MAPGEASVVILSAAKDLTGPSKEILRCAQNDSNCSRCRMSKLRQNSVMSSVGVRFPEIVLLPGGTFAMGSDDGRADERPVHNVFVGPFALGRYPVTNAEYAVFLRATGWPEPKAWGLTEMVMRGRRERVCCGRGVRVKPMQYAGGTHAEGPGPSLE